MQKEFEAIIKKDDDEYFLALVPSVKGSRTQAKYLDKLMERIKEAFDVCLDDKGFDIYPCSLTGV
jgi:predicted RNase H-like HicB family nuclease